MMIGYDNARIDEAAGITGYYFKGYMDYYCALLDTVILYDDALCFYDTTNYDDEALKDVKKSLTKEVLELLDDLQSISDKIANGQPIAGSYTLQDLVNKVDQLESAAASMGGAINVSAVVDPVKEILTNLGVGNLPGGYTLDDLSILSAKLKAVINDMNESQYDSINATFEELISSAMQRIGAIFTEIDQNGTLNGTPIDELMSRISMLGTIYNNYSVQIKKVISALADADFGSVDFDINAEEYEDIIFGRELDNIFNVDSILDAVKGKLGTSEKTGYDSVSQQYFIDKYSKTADGNTFSIERKFY